MVVLPGVVIFLVFVLENVEADTFFCFTSLMGEIMNNFIKTLDGADVGIVGNMTRLNLLLKEKVRVMLPAHEPKTLYRLNLRFHHTHVLIWVDFSRFHDCLLCLTGPAAVGKHGREEIAPAVLQLPLDHSVALAGVSAAWYERIFPPFMSLFYLGLGRCVSVMGLIVCRQQALRVSDIHMLCHAHVRNSTSGVAARILTYFQAGERGGADWRIWRQSEAAAVVPSSWHQCYYCACKGPSKCSACACVVPNMPVWVRLEV